MKTMTRFIVRIGLVVSICLLANSMLLGADIKPLGPGETAPSFSLPALDGTRESLNIWCGERLSKPYINKTPHTVILSFWATYCMPCRKEIPELMRFYEKHKKDNIKIFLISIDKEGASKVAPFVAEKKYTLPVLLDPYNRTASRYNVKSLPALIVIAPDGVIKYSSVGFKEGTNLEEKLEGVLAAIKSGADVEADTGQGETVAVQDDTDGGSEEEPQITAKQKWEAVAKVECGQSAENVAKELGVSTEELKSWYSELKEAAIEVWKSE